MVMSIYRLVVLRNFIRSCGKCTICYETASLQALHDRDYRHGICRTCKASYNKNECHMCRKSLSPLRIRPALTIDTSMSLEPRLMESLLNSVFAISEEAMEQEQYLCLASVREDLESYLNEGSHNDMLLRRIHRNLFTFLDYYRNPMHALSSRLNTMVRDNLSIESLLYIIDETIRYSIRYEQTVNAIVSFNTHPSIITNIIESIFDIEKYVKLITDSRYLPEQSREEMIQRIWVALQNLSGAVYLNEHTIDVSHDRCIDSQTLYNIFSMEDRTNSAQLISTIWTQARVQ